MGKTKKKYQIFVSSTFIDLIEERQTAVEAIVKMGHIPAGMELFKAGKSQWQTITKWIDESDIYVLILGGRYGSLDETEGKSYTHLEYEYALSQGKPVFALVLTDKFIKEKELKDPKIVEHNNKEKYNEFRNMVLKKIVKHIDDLKDIKIELPEDVREIESTHKLEGWSKGAASEDAIEYMKENLKLLKENNQLKEKIKKLKKESEKEKQYTTTSGIPFLELYEMLKKEEINIPEEIAGKKDEKRTLLNLFFYNTHTLAGGVSNYVGTSNTEKFIFSNVAKKLLSYGIVDTKNGPNGAIWSTISLNDDGKKFYAFLKKEEIVNING